MADDFTVPDFLSNQSADDITENMLANLPDYIDKSEAGFAWDMVLPSAIEKAEMVEQQLQEAIKIMFPAYAYDTWLDKHAAARGLTRKSAVTATGTVTVSGTVGTIIPAGFQFSTEATIDESAVVFDTTANATIPSGGSVDIAVEADVAGTTGNVSAGAIALQVAPLTGISSVTNALATSGGTATESDDDLKERIAEYDADQGTSYVGSDADYKRWALEVDGVGSVSVIDPTDDTGVIRIILLDSNGDPASTAIQTAVYNHIMRPDDVENRLASTNDKISVEAPKSLNVSVSATVMLDDSASVATVEAALTASLKAWYPTAIAQGTLRYSKVGALLDGIAGVLDYSGLTINGGTANIAITADEVPVTESVAIST